jgi:hypothetical protein
MYSNKNTSQFKQKQTRQKKKNILIFIGLIFFVAVLLLIFEKTGITNFYEKNVDSESQSPIDGINLQPATEEEIQDAEDNKLQIVDLKDKQSQTTEEEQTSTYKTEVKPVIGYIEVLEGQINANGFITTMIEEGGTCTLKLTKDDQSFQTTSTSLADAQSTVCGLMQISANGLSQGNWIATISYSSDKYEGLSEEQIVEVKN